MAKKSDSIILSAGDMIFVNFDSQKRGARTVVLIIDAVTSHKGIQAFTGIALDSDGLYRAKWTERYPSTTAKATIALIRRTRKFISLHK